MLNVREIHVGDIPLIAKYWLNNDAEYLRGLGVDVLKLPTSQNFTAMLLSQINLPYPQKKGYALIWEANGKAVGHSNLNPVVYGEEASMHLHIWSEGNRKKGYGLELIKMSLPFYFDNMQLKRIVCEPYALNNAPNRVLERAGFAFVKEYVTTPGSITFEQPVKQWVLEK